MRRWNEDGMVRPKRQHASQMDVEHETSNGGRWAGRGRCEGVKEKPR